MPPTDDTSRLPRLLRVAESVDGPGAFAVLQWNVLADRLAESGGFIRAPAECLQWSARGDGIVERILRPGGAADLPDIVCLQEVDHYLDHVEPALRDAGFAGVFEAKAEGRDGCCVLWQRQRFSQKWARPVRYTGEDGRPQTQLALLVALEDAKTHIVVRDAIPP